MSGYLQKIVNDDFMWRAISERIAGQGSRSATNFINIKCPVCNDYKRRCGIINNGKIVVSCYNCSLKTGWSLGSPLGKKFRSSLSALGMSESEIAKLNYKAFSYKNTIQQSPEANLYLPTQNVAPTFPTMRLPPGSKSIKLLAEEGCTDKDFLDAQAYIAGRGAEVAASYEYYWSPETKHDLNRRIIIPCLYEGRIVGYSARAIDKDNKQRYHMIVPPNYLFNSAAMARHNRKYIIIVEGILDAIAIDGVATLGAHLNAAQIDWIKSQNKIPIVLVDRDEEGQELTKIALANDWHISFASGGINYWWDPAVKDAAQAVSLYGSLWTVTSIISEATNNKMKINFQRKKILAT